MSQEWMLLLLHQSSETVNRKGLEAPFRAPTSHLQAIPCTVKVDLQPYNSGWLTMEIRLSSFTLEEARGNSYTPVWLGHACDNDNDDEYAIAMLIFQ